MRLRAIACCLWFGGMYWRVYETKCHFTDGYWSHLWRNLRQSWKWLSWHESAQDREFEKNTNRAWGAINWLGGIIHPRAQKRVVWCENEHCKIQFYADGSCRLLFIKRFATYKYALHSATDDLTFIGDGI